MTLDHGMKGKPWNLTKLVSGNEINTPWETKNISAKAGGGVDKAGANRCLGNLNRKKLSGWRMLLIVLTRNNQRGNNNLMFGK